MSAVNFDRPKREILGERRSRWQLIADALRENPGTEGEIEVDLTYSTAHQRASQIRSSLGPFVGGHWEARVVKAGDSFRIWAMFDHELSEDEEREKTQERARRARERKRAAAKSGAKKTSPKPKAKTAETEKPKRTRKPRAKKTEPAPEVLDVELPFE